MILIISLLIIIGVLTFLIIHQELRYRQLKRLSDTREKYHRIVTKAYYDLNKKYEEVKHHERDV